MEQLRWITRVPLSLCGAKALVTQFPSEALSESPLDGYRLLTYLRNVLYKFYLTDNGLNF
jgi:hypothetical protein